MCVPCIVIINGCATGNNAANSFINTNEQFAEAVRYMVDNGTLSDADGKLVVDHCQRYVTIARELDEFTAATVTLVQQIAMRTPNPKVHAG